MLIAYCESCGFRIPESDLESGAARKKGDNQYVCAKCAGSAAPPAQKKPASKGHAAPVVEAPKPAGAPSAVSIPAARRETVAPKPVAQKSDSTMFIVGGGVAAVVVLGLLFALSGKGNDDSTKVSREDKKQPTSVTPPAVKPTDLSTAKTPSLPNPSVVPQPNPSNDAPPVSIPKKTEDQERAEREIIQMREERAMRLLEEHKAWFAAHGDDPRTYKDKLTALIDGNRSTPAATEAQKIVADLKIPETVAAPVPVPTPATTPNPVTPPPAIAGKGWRTLADTSTLETLMGKGSGGWKVENGALVNIPTVAQGTQTQAEFDDGDLRIRFELRDAQYAQFTARMAEQPGYCVEFNRVEIPQMAGKTHELIFSMRGDTVTATLNGQPAKVDVGPGKTRRGHLQFYAKGGVLRVLSIEIAEPGAAVAVVPKTPVPAAAPAVNLLSDSGFESGAFVIGPTGWNNWGRCEIAKSQVHAHSGEFCGVMSPGTSCLGRLVTGLTPGATYELSGWGKMANAGEAVMFGVKEYGAADKTENFDTTEYKRVSLKFTMGATNTTAAIFAWRGSGAGVAYVDDISLVLDGPQAGAAAKPEPGAAGSTADLRPKYEQFFAEISALEFKNSTQAALSKLEGAKSDPKWPGLQTVIEQDINAARRVESLNALVSKGAALLADKRAFVLKKPDGKEVRVGKGNASTVVEFKDDCLTIDQDIGGAKALSKWTLDQLSFPTRYELAKLASAGADDELALACAATVLLQNGAPGMTATDVRAALAGAKKSGAAPELVAHLQQRMDSADAEIASDAALKRLEGMLASKRFADAKAALPALKKELTSAQATAKLTAFETKLGEAEAAANPIKPGLWTSYWSGDAKNQFKTKHVARPETVITHDWGNGSPDPAVPADYFGIIFAGILRVEKDGKYKFTVQGDDAAYLKIDNKAVKDGAQIPLAKGDHEIQIIHIEGVGGARVAIKWNDQDLPPTALFHDSRLIERYEKK